MRIDEFTQNQESEVPYNLVDDVVVFMRNDPTFYRKKYFPAMATIADSINNNKEIDRDSHLNPLVDSAINTYCKKYNIARSPADIFTLEDRGAIMDLLFSEELENIKKGDYS